MTKFADAAGYAIGSFTCAVLLVAAYQLVRVYAFGHFDPKFGPGGTIQLALMVVSFAGAVAAIGGSFACLVLQASAARLRLWTTLLLGAFSGAVVAWTHMWVFRMNPLGELLPEIPAYLVAFLLLGSLLGITCVLSARLIAHGDRYERQQL